MIGSLKRGANLGAADADGARVIVTVYARCVPSVVVTVIVITLAPTASGHAPGAAGQGAAAPPLAATARLITSPAAPVGVTLTPVATLPTAAV